VQLDGQKTDWFSAVVEQALGQEGWMPPQISMKWGETRPLPPPLSDGINVYDATEIW